MPALTSRPQKCGTEATSIPVPSAELQNAIDAFCYCVKLFWPMLVLVLVLFPELTALSCALPPPRGAVFLCSRARCNRDDQLHPAVYRGPPALTRGSSGLRTVGPSAAVAPLLTSQWPFPFSWGQGGRSQSSGTRPCPCLREEAPRSDKPPQRGHFWQFWPVP